MTFWLMLFKYLSINERSSKLGGGLADNDGSSQCVFRRGKKKRIELSNQSEQLVGTVGHVDNSAEQREPKKKNSQKNVG